MIAVKIEIKECLVTDYLLFVDGKGPFEVLGYVYSYLSKLSQMGYCIEVKELIARHGGDKLSDVPLENYVEFIDSVQKLYKETTEG